MIDGKFPENDHVYVMETPEVLQGIGLKKLPMLMTQKHAYTTTMAEGKYSSTDVNYHALGLETMQKLPDAIADPLMVIKSHNYDGRITVITELADKKGYSVIVPVIVEGYGVWQNVNVDTNMIASVYGRKNVIGDMKKAFANNEVLYLDKEKSDLIAQNLGVQFPDTMNEDRSSEDIIADFARAVKGENSENQQKISESGEENADQAQNEGETEQRKFALKKSVEQIEDLVAAHNTTADKLSKTLDPGGFPMPSIAITKTGIAHSDFGEITLTFGCETVKPLTPG